MSVILKHESATIETNIPRLPNGDIDESKIQPLSFARAGEEDGLGIVSEGVIKIGSGKNVTPIGNEGVLRYRDTVDTHEIIGTGDNVEVVFTNTLRNNPVIEVFTISVNAISLADLVVSELGDISSSVLDAGQTNNIDFNTGIMTITFIVAPLLDDEITVDYNGTIVGVVEQSDGNRWLGFMNDLPEVDYITGAIVFGD